MVVEVDADVAGVVEAIDMVEEVEVTTTAMVAEVGVEADAGNSLRGMHYTYPWHQIFRSSYIRHLYFHRLILVENLMS